MNDLRIGVVGYSSQKFDEDEAKLILESVFDVIEYKFPKQNKVIISGLTNLGIPKLAYEEARKRKWLTVGIACEQAKDYELFPVDKQYIYGKEWGDESKLFLKNVDILVRVGGGKQSLKEVKNFKLTNKPIIEYDLN